MKTVASEFDNKHLFRRPWEILFFGIKRKMKYKIKGKDYAER